MRTPFIPKQQIFTPFFLEYITFYGMLLFPPLILISPLFVSYQLF